MRNVVCFLTQWWNPVIGPGVFLLFYTWPLCTTSSHTSFTACLLVTTTEAVTSQAWKNMAANVGWCACVRSCARPKGS